MATGDTWDQIDNDWDIPRLRAMNKYWKDYPPLHILVQSFLGELPAKPAAPMTAGADLSGVEAAGQPADQPDLLDTLQAFPQAR